MDPGIDYAELLQWNQPCEPIDEDDFINDDLLRKSSIILQLTYNTYQESDDENDKKSNKTKKQKVIAKQPAKPTVTEVKQQSEVERSFTPNKKYIPGLLDKSPRFPSYSTISADEQALYLKLVKKFTAEKLPFLNRNEQAEFQVFVNLHRRVQSEQRDYVNFARKQQMLEPIKYEMMDPVCRSYIETVLSTRQKTIPLNYHPLYAYATAISLSKPSVENPVEMIPVKELLSLGTVAFFKQPLFEKKVELPNSLEILEKNYPSNCQLHPYLLSRMVPGEKYLYNTPVSEDSNASTLAVLHGADVVVSSSVLETLVDCHPNHPQNCAPPRDIPVVIRMVQGPNGKEQKVVFLDKVLPPVAMALYEKKKWYSRRAARLLFCQRNERIYNFSTCQELFSDRAMDSTETCRYTENNRAGKEKTFEEELASYQQLKQTMDKNAADCGKTNVSSQDGELLPPPHKTCKLDGEVSSKEDVVNDHAGQPGDQGKDELEDGEIEDTLPDDISHNCVGAAVMPAPNRNMVYGLWSIHRKNTVPLADSQWERTAEDIKLVIRTGYHAYELDEKSGNATLLHTSVKLEHQPQFGAQTSTVGEVVREWMSLYLRPNSVLYRVHVAADTMEVIQMQRLTLRDIVKEARQRQLSPTHSFGALHNILSQLRQLDCGQYLLKLRPLDGWTEVLRQDTSGTRLRGGQQFFNLHIEYHRSESHEGPSSKVPYSPIDTDLTTPYHLHYHRVPGTYKPSPSQEKKKAKEKERRNRKKLLKLKKRAEAAILAVQKKKDSDPQSVVKTDLEYQNEELSDDSQLGSQSQCNDLFLNDSPTESADDEQLVIVDSVISTQTD